MGEELVVGSAVGTVVVMAVGGKEEADRGNGAWAGLWEMSVETVKLVRAAKAMETAAVEGAKVEEVVTPEAEVEEQVKKVTGAQAAKAAQMEKVEMGTTVGPPAPWVSAAATVRVELAA